MGLSYASLSRLFRDVRWLLRLGDWREGELPKRLELKDAAVFMLPEDAPDRTCIVRAGVVGMGRLVERVGLGEALRIERRETWSMLLHIT